MNTAIRFLALAYLTLLSGLAILQFIFDFGLDSYGTQLSRIEGLANIGSVLAMLGVLFRLPFLLKISLVLIVPDAFTAPIGYISGDSSNARWRRFFQVRAPALRVLG